MIANVYEARARAVKVAKLVRVLDRVTAEMHWDNHDLLAAVEEAPGIARARVARLARTNIPSEATWAAVIGTLAARIGEPVAT